VEKKDDGESVGGAGGGMKSIGERIDEGRKAREIKKCSELDESEQEGKTCFAPISFMLIS
jgi:hypothetical protein